MSVETNSKKMQGYYKSYLVYVGYGLLAGIITRLSDFFPNDDLWSFSSIATLFGFWMVTVTVIIYFSSSNINAAINVLIYLLSMNFSFYFLKYVLGFFIPMFHNDGFQWGLLFMFNVFAFVCSLMSYVLYFWNKKNKWNSILYALPISGLTAETIGVSVYLYNNHTFLFQVLFNSISLIILGYWFYKKANNKRLYLATVVAIFSTGYFLVYQPFI